MAGRLLVVAAPRELLRDAASKRKPHHQTPR